jgi:hypothetical protein
MNFKRVDCPICGHTMYYIWPSPQSDPAVERVISRFQECRIGCKSWRGDVQTGRAYNPVRLGEDLVVGGVSYPSVGAWLRAIGIIGDNKRAGDQ